MKDTANKHYTETALLERALGLFSLAWGLLSLGALDTNGYLLCTTPLLLLSIPQTMAAGKPQLVPRLAIALMSASVWVAIAFIALDGMPLTMENARSITAYLGLIGASAYVCRELGLRLGYPARLGLTKERSKHEKEAKRRRRDVIQRP